MKNIITIMLVSMILAGCATRQGTANQSSFAQSPYSMHQQNHNAMNTASKMISPAI